MRVALYGAGGFLGHRLAEELVRIGQLGSQPIDHLQLIDQSFSRGQIDFPGIEYIEGDLCDHELNLRIIQGSPDVIFHLAAIVSGEAEKNFELGMKVNLEATQDLLETCRQNGICPRFVFASSCAVYGGDVTVPVTDITAPVPRSSYGTQKAIAELLVNDYSRRGLIDGVSLRLPTIAIRPGAANAATSSFVSAIIREPLNGEPTNCPVPGETEVWIQSPRKVISNFMHAATIPSEQLGLDRIVALPGLTVSVNEMIDCLEDTAGPAATKLVSWEADAFLRSIVLTWPPHFNLRKAVELGFEADASVEEIVRTYIEEEEIKI